jgi:hypothetical protein
LQARARKGGVIAMRIALAVLCVLVCSVSTAEDLYLKNGFAVRNVQVVDTTGGRITIVRDGEREVYDSASVLRIEYRPFVPGERSTYVLFSEEMALRHRGIAEGEIDRRETQVADSQESVEKSLDSLHSWRRSVYLAGGWGVPHGTRFELGYSTSGVFSFAFSFGIGDSWFRDPGERAIALLTSLRFPIRSSRITPYLLLGIGATGALYDRADTYAIASVGTLIALRSGIHLRPELGGVFISKHVSDGVVSFWGTSPEVREYRSRFGAHIAVELDFRSLW